MIVFKNKNKERPYIDFYEFYNRAFSANQKSIEAICISSYDPSTKEVNSRFVNLKYLSNNEWIFFTNYNSPKSKQFFHHDQVSALIYWDSINVQIRIKAFIQKSSKEISDSHFSSRTIEKNALAISSNQSKRISSFEAIQKNYQDSLNQPNSLLIRPESWGGFSFKPYYFEFWEGHQARLNKRNIYEKNDSSWNHFILEP
jgi:pyridoxamine 5'-phosphate oxidase